MSIGRQLHQAERQFRKLQNHKFNLRNQSSTCEIFSSHVSTCEIHLCNPRYLRPTLLDFFFRYFLFKSLFSHCNQPIIGFLSQEVRRKGEQPFYIIYCNFLLKYLSGVFLRDQLCIVLKKVKHRALLYLTYSF